MIPRGLPPNEEVALGKEALQAVKRAVRYEHAGSIRAHGIEVLQRHLGERSLPWIRLALQDEEPGVRFAAVLALGTLTDKQSEPDIHKLLDDPNPSVRIATYYALHRLGDTGYMARLPALLLDDPSPEVRRNTAFVLGLLGEAGAVKLLAKAMKDNDESVRNQVLESMAMLKNTEAIRQLTFSISSGAGRHRVTALGTLAELTMPSLENTFKYKLREGEYIETRLAAARGLGMLDNDDGFRLALAALSFNRPQRNIPRDPPQEQIMRVRQLAAKALGAIGDRRALPALRKQLYDSGDPRIQLSAADAILEILGTASSEHTPWLRLEGQSLSGGGP